MSQSDAHAVFIEKVIQTALKLNPAPTVSHKAIMQSVPEGWDYDQELLLRIQERDAEQVQNILYVFRVLKDYGVPHKLEIIAYNVRDLRGVFIGTVAQRGVSQVITLEHLPREFFSGDRHENEVRQTFERYIWALASVLKMKVQFSIMPDIKLLNIHISPLEDQV